MTNTVNFNKKVVIEDRYSTDVPSSKLKIAKVFDVSVDYLITEAQLSCYDKDVLKPLEYIEHLPVKDKVQHFLCHR